MDQETAGPTLEIELLGDFRLTYGGKRVGDVDTPRIQSLLAYLLLHRGASQPRRRIAFLFWPDSTEGQALTNLRNLLYRLRQSLPDAERFLEVDRKILRWREDAPFDLDVAAFEEALERVGDTPGASAGAASGARQTLERAVELYEGDLLPGCYDDWIEFARERLRRSYRGALIQLIDFLEQIQDYRAAIEAAERLVRHDPLREVSYRRLMKLRAAIGDRVGALRTYHRCATALERELGLEPSPVTQDVYERLLAADESSQVSGAPARRTAGSPVLVDRDDAWSRLQQAWRRAGAAVPHMALISGETGIGKTRLAEELVRWASRQGILNGVARCYVGEGELAYAPIAAWLRALPRPRLDPVWRSEVARILPELAAESPELAVAGSLSEAWERNRFFEALVRALLGRDQPLLLMIDALQWCDEGTFDWLQYMLQREVDERFLVVGTYRPGSVDHDHPMTSLIHQLRQDERITEIELGPLSRRETSVLAQSLVERELPRTLTDCLYAETEGNPLFIVETVRAGLPEEVHDSPSGGFVCIPHPLPSKMQDALIARVDQLSPLARGLAEVAATIGREFTFDVVAVATTTSEETLIRGLDELWQRRIIREQGEDAYDFSHGKLRDVIYGQLSGARRRMLHRHVARALETVYADEMDEVVARLADHCERADEWEMAIAYYERAAAVADRLHADTDVARYRRRADALRHEESEAS